MGVVRNGREAAPLVLGGVTSALDLAELYQTSSSEQKMLRTSLGGVSTEFPAMHLVLLLHNESFISVCMCLFIWMYLCIYICFYLHVCVFTCMYVNCRVSL